ncbi:RICIN domain-containing protein [Streptacidiphilus carbonis]|uniref:RICIN domain-containing protein n=1 Tax=Streptacidiphilus carbonis TaxID=105422 RepID=UPI000A004DFC|nr:RICIN domain-containing protein [Streptacidiphilus carbonis]
MDLPGNRSPRRSRPGRRLRLLCLLLSGLLLLAFPGTAGAVTTGNGSLVYSPTAGSSFDPAGTTYAKTVVLKHSGSSNGRILVTYDQLVWVNGKQVYPIYSSDDNGATWTHLTDVVPGNDFSSLIKTSQPFLYEVPQTVGSLAAGTILLAGNIMPSDKSSTRLVIYKSTDHGASFSYLSTVDTGGPATYDPSPTSTTTSVWEPSLAVDKAGALVCYFSDERQKASGILQAVSYRVSSDGGSTWGTEGNVTAIANDSDRPGMITVTPLPNGTYMATYEVVNRPSQTLNTAVVYYKFSSDGVTWTASDLGTPIRLANGRGLGSSPYVKWVAAGGPNGMVVVSAKWALDSSGNISGGQNFYVNYNLGQGPWERLPFATTYDAGDTQGGYFAGFAQAFDTGVDGNTLYQATDVENTTTGYNDIRVGSIPLNAHHYEAERATLTDVTTVSQVDADNGSKIGNINHSDSKVSFTHVNVPTAGTYTVNVRYDNGTGATSSHSVSVNGGTAFTLSYPKTVDWNRYGWAQFTTTLAAGNNTVSFGYNGTYAELDAIDVYQSGVAADGEFKLVNRNSGKYLEIASALTTEGAPAGQWGDTDNPTQVWRIGSSSGAYTLTDLNSGKLLTVSGASTANGAAVVQNASTGSSSQRWTLTPTDSGYATFTDVNSGKLLEIYQNSTADGAIADQWSATGYNCQQWLLVKEGIQ